MSNRKKSSAMKSKAAAPVPKKKARMNEVTVQFNYNRKENTSRHHTDEYENNVLVLRRGATFDLGLQFQHLDLKKIQESVLRFSIEPKRGIHTQAWETKIANAISGELSLSCQIKIPVNAAVGRYTIEVFVPQHSTKPLQQSGQIIVLFNPWNKDDEVYLAEEELRNEYLLSDFGLLYVGWDKYGPRPANWIFGQFEVDVLDCVLYLLESDRRIKKKPLKSLSMRSSPVWVSRILSAMINSQDDDGVLVGNWSGNYDEPEGSVAPWSWNGSVKILQDYYKKKEPVSYGQCWVFSGVLTTALRAIGIPARSVTNYDSAHDTDNTMTIDKFIDQEGETVKELDDDSIWNFHVWNEIWTKRKDLPGEKYDGWQAVDATPQEESFQLYQTGPAPLTAIKDGEVYAGFDTGFVFSEVNADCVTWVVKKNENDEYEIQKASKQSRSSVGNYISTKRVGSREREDITHLYKHAEGTTAERKAFETAYSFGEGAKDLAGHLHVEEEGNDLELEVSTKEEDLRLGKPITFVMSVKNKSKENFNVHLTGVITSVKYTGDLSSLVKKEKFENVKIGSGKSVTKEIELESEEYIKKLTDLNCLKFVLVANVLQTKKFYVDEATFQVLNQDSITIKFNEKPLQVGEKAEVEVTFKNPLLIRLSYIRISIEGAGLAYPDIKRYRKSLKHNETLTATFSFTPRKPGKRTLLVDVDTTQVKDFKAAADVDVLPVNEHDDQA